MTHARKFKIVDIETNEILAWSPLGREEKIGANGATSLTGLPAKIVHFREGTAIVWRDGTTWRALRSPGLPWNKIYRGEFSEKMKKHLAPQTQWGETPKIEALKTELAELEKRHDYVWRMAGPYPSECDYSALRTMEDRAAEIRAEIKKLETVQ